MKDKADCYEILLNYNCNASCMFCSQGSFDKSLNASFEHIVREIYQAKKSGYKRLGLSGGEPTIRSDLVKIIKFAKKIGFDFIRIQTNGIKLANADFAEKLVEAGLTFCKFSFVSDDAQIHNSLVKVKGAWEKAIRGLENLKKLKIRLGNNILINRFNYKRLTEIINFFLDKGISNFVMIYPLYIGNMAKNSGRIGVDLNTVSPYLIKVMDRMKKYGLDDEILFLNVPPCFLPGYEQNVIGLSHFNTVVSDPTGERTDLDQNANLNKIQGKACQHCLFKAKCPGVDINYIKTWGWKGFKPVKKLSEGGKKIKSSYEYFTDNERCFLEILGIKNNISTNEVLSMAKNIPICQDCIDGNAVLNAGNKLIKRGLIVRKIKKGVYYWSLK